MSLADKIGKVFSRKRLGILAGVLLLYAFWIYGLSTNPPGFYVDESCIAYNGYLLATTGAQEDGTSFPIYIHCYTQGWSQYMSAGQPYALALLYLFISPSVLSARIFAATIVFLAVLLLGLLAARISRRTSVGIIVALSGMATPWFFEYSRLVMETFVLILFIALFLFSLHNAQKRERWKITDVLVIAGLLTLITYSYATGRVIAPLFAVGLLIFAVNVRALFDVFKVWAIYAITMIPMIIVYLKEPLVISGRFLRATNLSRENSLLENIGAVASALYQDISLKFFVIQGDELPRHHVPDAGMGEFLVGTFVLGLLGIAIVLIRHRSDPWWRFILYGAVATLLPGAITFERYHSMRALGFPIFFLILTVPAISWLMGWYNGKPDELSDILGGSGSFRSPMQRNIRLGVLSGLLLLTALQAVQFQWVFWQNGVSPTRKAVFHEAYPRVLARALAEESRPIYLQDSGEPTYMLALWHAATWGYDKSNFVHLLDRQNPPEGALVLSSKGSCTDCQVIFQDGFILYRNEKPDISSIEAPVPANPAKAPSVFNAGPGSDPGQLSRPKGLAADASGNLYIADSGNGRIQKFDPDGKFLIAFGQDGPSETHLKDPSGVAVDADGSVWVVDVGIHKLIKFNSDGIFADALEGPDTGFYGPRDIFAGPNKKLYIVDQGRGRIAVFDAATGTFSLVFGERGPAEAEFAEPTGIASTGEYVFVTDLGNSRIQVFDLAGKFIRQWEIPTWKKESDETPDVVFDDVTKTVYVSSVKTGEILAFDIEGNPRQGFKPEGDEKLTDPTAMAIAEANKKRWLYVENTGTSTVSRFELEIVKKKK